MNDQTTYTDGMGTMGLLPAENCHCENFGKPTCPQRKTVSRSPLMKDTFNLLAEGETLIRRKAV